VLTPEPITAASPTHLDSELIEAYSATEYRVDSDPPLALAVGVASSALKSVYSARRVDSAAFVTAYNPFSQQLSEQQNAFRQEALGAELAKRGLTFIAGVGQHPSGDWPGEPSFLVLGIALEAAKSLGRQFEQNAIIWCGPDAVPILILLR
jgi:hypothetical protein